MVAQPPTDQPNQGQPARPRLTRAAAEARTARRDADDAATSPSV